jgi:hypothetical protein
MNRFKITIVVTLSLATLLETRVYGTSGDISETKRAGCAPIITLTGLELGDRVLDLQYKIKNATNYDIWICNREGVNRGAEFEVYLAEDNQTLVIHRRLDELPQYNYRYFPYGHYVRLNPGEERNESLSLTIPINADRVWVPEGKLQNAKFARRIVIEIGYYAEDLPRKIYNILTEAEDNNNVNIDKNLAAFKNIVGGLLYFNELNESLRSRDEEVLIPYTNQALKGEKVLRISISDLLIPCEKKKKRCSQSQLFNLTDWSRIEISYEPSALEYFFPYAGQRRFLSLTEKQQLLSLKNIIVKNPQYLKEFADEISKGSHGGVVAQRNTAHVTCYRDGKYLTSFTVHDNMSIETEETHWIWFKGGLKSLKKVYPLIQQFDFRVHCASNLKNLWHRIRLYYKVEKNRLRDSADKTKMSYPISTKWCDLMMQAYQTLGMLDENIMRPLICPSAGEGKCHYAMNPNCKSDSPFDMVLLFETKAGWNQHGGPELFTFDNHDPKGGCVLLNDGTVKFIRTKEELQQLRWK